MLVYHNCGWTDYLDKRISPYHRRRCWEFQACLEGSFGEVLAKESSKATPRLRERTLWAFPKEISHGWRSSGPCERVVFHHTTVPAKLQQLLPPRGYFRVSITDKDCQRLREMSELAYEVLRKPTEIASLQTEHLSMELSLMVLRESSPRPQSKRNQAAKRTEQAIAWYSQNMNDNPGYEDVAKAVFLSPAHLRRLFQEARGESPQAVFQRMKMEIALDMFIKEDRGLDDIAHSLGFSSASSLSRAIKRFYGHSPREMREGKPINLSPHR